MNPSESIRLAGSGLTRRRFLRTAIGAAGVASMGSVVSRATAARQQATSDIAATDLGGLRLLAGAGANVLAMPGPEGALMVDGGLRANADRLLSRVGEVTGTTRVHTLINTHWHPAQTGANEAVGRGGGVIFAHEKTALYLGSTVYSSATFDGRLDPLAPEGRPNRTTRGDGSLQFAGQRIDYGYLPAAHTDGDLYVYFPASDVLAVGGVASGEAWPLLDYRNGAWYGGRVRALEWLAEIVNADTRVVPADGRLMTGAEIVRQRDIYQELFTTLIAYMNRGYGAEDAVRDNPLSAYESEYGDPSEFLDGAYRSMLIAYVPD